MSEKAINDGQWNPWRLLQDAEFIVRDLSPDHDFPGRIRTAREAHDKAIASGTDPETAAEERGRLQGQFSPLGDNHHNAAACPHCGDLLTKAEERGRRRGVEERDELHRLALAVKHAKAEALARPNAHTRFAWETAEQRLLTAANALPDLAPRELRAVMPK